VGTKSEWSVLRDYAVPANLLKQGKNVITMRCMDWMGLGGMVAPEGGFRLEMGDQKIAISDWKWKKGADKKDLPIAPESGEPNISKLHQGMIAPLLPYTVKGALWYQGEANVGRATEYEQLFSMMIENWRSDFKNPKMPFYFVQIAPFTYGTPNQASARLRQAQLDTYHHVPNTGMVVVTDITGNLRDIHPRDKLHVGQRLAAWALAKNYGQKVMFSGPIYKSFRVIGKEIEISFDFATKLHAIGGQIRGFSVAGTDKKFLPAMARVVGNKVMVISPVDKPAAVRFGWEDAPELGVFDESGLPMSPFRSDNWEDAVMMVGQ
jgi:sialate O-acetylesterase